MNQAEPGWRCSGTRSQSIVPKSGGGQDRPLYDKVLKNVAAGKMVAQSVLISLTLFVHFFSIFILVCFSFLV